MGRDGEGDERKGGDWRGRRWMPLQMPEYATSTHYDIRWLGGVVVRALDS